MPNCIEAVTGSVARGYQRMYKFDAGCGELITSSTVSFAYSLLFHLVFSENTVLIGDGATKMLDFRTEKTTEFTDKTFDDALFAGSQLFMWGGYTSTDEELTFTQVRDYVWSIQTLRENRVEGVYAWNSATGPMVVSVIKNNLTRCLYLVDPRKLTYAKVREEKITQVKFFTTFVAGLPVFASLDSTGTIEALF